MATRLTFVVCEYAPYPEIDNTPTKASRHYNSYESALKALRSHGEYSYNYFIKAEYFDRKIAFEARKNNLVEDCIYCECEDEISLRKIKATL